MPTIHLIGPHGSGKSTIAQALATHFGGRMFSLGDACRALRKNHLDSQYVPQFVPRKISRQILINRYSSVTLPEASRWAVTEAVESFTLPIFVDGLLQTESDLTRIPWATTLILDLDCEPAECLRRREQRGRDQVISDNSYRDQLLPTLRDAIPMDAFLRYEQIDALPPFEYVKQAAVKAVAQFLTPLAKAA